MSDSLSDAIELVFSAKPRERSDGLGSLTRLFKLGKSSTLLDDLGDKGYHKICEAIFHAATTEISVYTRSKGSALSSSKTRLELCAESLRGAVSVGLGRLKSKTVKAIIDHIVQTVLFSDETYCVPLLTDYSKSLNLILGYAAHVEHLSRGDWLKLTEFCGSAINHFEGSAGRDGSFMSNGTSFASESDPTNRKWHGSTLNGKSFVRRSNATAEGPVSIRNEMLFCLAKLILSANSEYLGDQQATTSTLLRHLTKASGNGSADQAIFNALNRILSQAILRRISDAEYIALDLIPLLSRFWLLKKASLRDEIIVCWINLQSFFKSIVLNKPDVDCSVLLENFLDVIKKEYSSRLDRDILQLDDIRLHGSQNAYPNRSPFQLSNLELRGHKQASEHKWMVMSIAANITTLLDVENNNRDLNTSEKAQEPHSKRPKRESHFEELLIETKSLETSKQICALQILLFSAEVELEQVTAEKTFDCLLEILAGRNGTVTSWAMIVLSRYAMRAEAADKRFSSIWSQVWLLSRRGLGTPSTCRAASHLLETIFTHNLIPPADASSGIDSMFSSVEYGGPALLCDSSLSLWTFLLMWKASESPNEYSEASERVLRWLLSRWSPSKALDRMYTAQYNQNVETIDLLNLILATTGLELFKCTQQFGAEVVGHIGQSYISFIEKRELESYLLLLPQEKLNEKKSSRAKPALLNLSSKSNWSVTNGNLLLAYLDSELRETNLKIALHLSESNQQITRDSIRFMASQAIASVIFSSQSAFSALPQQALVKQEISVLWTNLMTMISESDSSQAHFTSLFEVLDGYLPDVLAENALHVLRTYKRDYLILLTELDTVINRCGFSQSQPDKNADPDLMELDEEFMNQASSSRMDALSWAPRQDIMLRTSSSAFHQSLKCYLRLITTADSSLDSSTSEISLSSGFIDYVSSLSSEELISAQSFFRYVIAPQSMRSREDAAEFLTQVSNATVQNYDFNGCETSHLLCLNMSSSLAEMWADPSLSDKLWEIGFALHRHFISRILERETGSSQVLLSLSEYFQKLLTINTDIGRNEALRSVRSSLFLVLKSGSVIVKFHVANRIPAIFGLFVLRTHDVIFDDILGSLPSDPDWIEGLALRLRLLASLAISWPTLLRKSIYRLFETPGLVPSSAPYARQCLQIVVDRLRLKGLKEILNLFAPQILYTWMESQKDEESPISRIPFTVFGYEKLEDLLVDVKDELAAQLLMRGDETELQTLATRVRIPIVNLIGEHFPKVFAYCIARDISIPPSSQDGQTSGSETRIRKHLSKDDFIGLVVQHVNSILFTLVNSIEQEDQFHKAFQKNPHYADASKAFQEMKVETAGAAIPVNQQPSFRARYILHEIDYIRTKLLRDQIEMWTPSSVCQILRSLIDTMHPALGSLHACSVIRKIRIVLAVAGPSVLQDYTLEMILHALRPFMTDQFCADDTLSIAQYLFTHGRAYLSETPSFVAGIALSILTSLRAFINSPYENTTQESEYHAVISRAQGFHTWFSNYLLSYDSPSLSSDTDKAFRAIVQSARNIRNEGNATTGTQESDLLLEILDDQVSARNLLGDTARNLTYRLLCHDFRRPSSQIEDVLRSDKLSAKNAVALWKSCNQVTVGRDYLQWVGRVLGRMFASTGTVPRELISESALEHLKKLSAGSKESHFSSRKGLIKMILDLIGNDQSRTVQTAERTIQILFRRYERSGKLPELVENIPESILKCVDVTTVYEPMIPYTKDILSFASISEGQSATEWSRDLCLTLLSTASSDLTIGSCTSVLCDVDGFAKEALPFFIHIILELQFDRDRKASKDLSFIINSIFNIPKPSALEHLKLLITILLYLRTKPQPRESSHADRDDWLDVDYLKAAEAAIQCKMFKSALLFYEIGISQDSEFRTSQQISNKTASIAVLSEIYTHVDEPDSFYGIQEHSGVHSVLAQATYERDGFRSLPLNSVLMDVEMRDGLGATPGRVDGIIDSLSSLNMNGIALSLLQYNKTARRPAKLDGSSLQFARKLEQWDLPFSRIENEEAAAVYKTLQDINSVADLATMKKSVDNAFEETLSKMSRDEKTGLSLLSSLRTLSVLTEIDEIICCENMNDLNDAWKTMKAREGWMQVGNFGTVDQILSCRETILSSLARHEHLQELLGCSARDAYQLEAKCLLQISVMSREHGSLNHALTSSTRLSSLVEKCLPLGLHYEAAASVEASNVLWDQGESTASIGILRSLVDNQVPEDRDMKAGKSSILAKLGSQISEARMENPDSIIEHYLLPAIRELKSEVEGQEAGRVFHTFAAFCDQQLQNADSTEELNRLHKLSSRRQQEVTDLDKMIKSGAPNKSHLQGLRSKAKRWFDIDNRDYERLLSSRQTFMKRSLENYLKSLRACDDYNNDSLRFCALWLQHSDDDAANITVSGHLPLVASRKFAPLISQLSSRLLDRPDHFSSLLFALVVRICTEHPYHSMYQIFASGKSKGGKDEMSALRHSAAMKIIARLQKDKLDVWGPLSNVATHYVKLAQERLDDRHKPGSRVKLAKLQTGPRFEKELMRSGAAPPTMRIDLRPDCDYNNVPVITKVSSEVTIASGVSAPKILSVLASNGAKFKQLVKEGNDDLRQDSVMEQVFEQVSDLLQKDRSTKQRNLRIRTYKVLPLTTRAGIIEFVPNTIPLHDYLIPAHQKHYPRDWKPTKCRKTISDAQSKSTEERLEAYQQVTRHFHPVLRYFFTELFDNPDEWFDKRVAYSRSTAAISMLGYVLGLGDRHGHNILLDECTGEAVHIDLGVAFEQGRVLPVPEVVPFRLTRDIVDGMGITKTEGVFRRCCELTLTALRNESYSIMTILDVLRYDPLYHWTVSPVRAKRMQEAQSVAPQDAEDGLSEPKKKDSDEPNEADRALSVVAKKLSKGLSATATVNELIQQATNERNLAVLYAGWAAYA